MAAAAHAAACTAGTASWCHTRVATSPSDLAAPRAAAARRRDGAAEVRGADRPHGAADVVGAGLDEHFDAPAHVVGGVKGVGVGAYDDLALGLGDPDVHGRRRRDTGVLHKPDRVPLAGNDLPRAIGGS